MNKIKYPNPPEEPPRFDINPENLLEKAQVLIQRTRKSQDYLAATVKIDAATFSNTLLVLADDNGHRQRESGQLEFYQLVATDETIRAASREAQRVLNEFSIECMARKDIYSLIDAVHHRHENLDPESEQLLFEERRQFILNRLNLPSEGDRARFQEIKSLIADKSIEFRKNCGDLKGSLWFTIQELEGVPEQLVDKLEKGTGMNADKLRVTIQYTYTILKSASCGETRRRMFITEANSHHKNVCILKSILILRDEAARLLGYSNHAELRLEDSMFKSLKNASDFLANLRTQLQKIGESEIQALLKLKKKDLESRGEACDGKFYLWDRWYYTERMQKQLFLIDETKVNEYFPIDSTILHMLEILEDLFGLKFRAMETDFVWHKDVRAYTVWSQEEENPQSANLEFLGYLYMDLLSREGKIPRCNQTFLLQPGFTDSNGKRWYPATALICNFPPPTELKPTLLSHNSVWVLFHELGHSVHDLVSKARYARFHGANNSQDFGEAPSQMLEYWCWRGPTLRRISQHYSTASPEYYELWKKEQASQNEEEVPPDIPMRIPEDMLKNLIKTEKYNAALFHLSTIQKSVFDLTVHSPASHEEAQSINTSHLWNFLAKDIVGIEGPETHGEGYEWGHPEAQLWHLLDEYDARYYSYISSKVYASDMFYSKFAADPTNAREGRRYRQMILEKGGSMDKMRMLTQYLGRAPSLDAFYKELGLETL